MKISDKEMRKVGKAIEDWVENFKKSVERKAKDEGLDWNLADDGSMDTVIEVCDKESGKCEEVKTQPEWDDFAERISEDTGVAEKKVQEIIDGGAFLDELSDLRVYMAADIALDDAWQLFED